MKQPRRLYIYGTHAVAEALRHAPPIVRKLFLAPPGDKTLRALARAAGIPTEPLDPRKVTSMVEGNAPHQGAVALIAQEALVRSAEEFLASFVPTADTVLVFLSEVQDPHNVGAIIRSAAALGAAAVLVPTHKQSPITAAVVKTSAGAVFAVPLVAVDNPQQTIARLKKMGVRVYGLAAEGSVPLEGESFAGPSLLVVGNEAEGIAPYAKALCDTTLSIHIDPKVESLNVAASAAIALYAWRRTRQSGQ